MSIKFSIITINYNNALGLTNTIKSVLEQEYKDFEYVVIDGGSTDGSVEVIAQYSSHIDYSVSERDNGVYHAMNKGIKAANGQYIIFMNSGDSFYDIYSLSIYATSIISEEYGVYYGNSIGLSHSKKNMELNQPKALNLYFWLFRSLNHQATAIKRELFDLYGLYEENVKITADWRFFMQLNLVHQIKFKHINHFLAYYDLHGISSDKAMDTIHLSERETFIQEKFPQFWTEYRLIQKAETPIIKSKREKHFEHIQQFPLAYRFLKTFMDILLLFLPKGTKD